MQEQDLKHRTIHGVSWSAIDNVATYAISFLVGIVLARLLSPDDYGLIGIISIFTAIGTAIINGGFANALIRKKNVCDDDYNTAFIVNIILSVLLYVILFFSAPVIARFFNRAELISLTRVSSLGLILGALALVQETRLTKNIEFKKQTKITIIASVISGILGIILAIAGVGVWALVYQILLCRGIRTILLCIYNRWIPKLHFSKSSFSELFGFAWKIMIAHIIDNVWKESYQVVVGKFYSPATLGQYSRGKGYSEIFSTNITSVIRRVTFPVLSELQDDKGRMIAAYRRIIKLTMFVTVMCLFFLGAISTPLLYCLIGAKWHEAATYLPLMCIAGSLFPLHSLNMNMLQVQGRSDLFLGIEIVKKIICLIPLLIGALIGIMPMLYFSIITEIICYFINSYYPGKLLGYSSIMQLKDVAPSYGLAFLVAAPIWCLKYLPISYWFILPLQLFVGVGIFFVICEALQLEEYKELKAIIKSLVIK